MSTFTRSRNPHLESLTWTHTKRRVDVLVIDLVSPEREVGVQVPQCPDRLLPWRDGLGYLTNLFHDLCIADKIVDKLGISCPEQTLDHRSVTRFGPRPRLLHASIVIH